MLLGTRTWGGAKPWILPDGGRMVEWLESTGTQYIDTGYAPSKASHWVTDVQFTDFPSDISYIFGLYQPGASFRISINTTRFRFGSRDGSWHMPRNVDTLRHTLTLSARDGCYGIDTSTWNLPAEDNWSTSHSLALFAQHQPAYSPTVSYYSKAKVWRSTIYTGNTLSRDFHPAIDGNGVPAMWDSVSSNYFHNAGTGSFIAGPIVGGG